MKKQLVQYPRVQHARFVSFTMVIPYPVRNALKAYAARRGVTMAGLLVQWILDGIRRGK